MLVFLSAKLILKNFIFLDIISKLTICHCYYKCFVPILHNLTNRLEYADRHDLLTYLLLRLSTVPASVFFTMDVYLFLFLEYCSRQSLTSL